MITPALATALAPDRPNIVYIMADDLGYGDVGCFGQKKIPTPNIDRIAREGIRMTRAYAGSPVCAPTRYSLMTGLHQGHAFIRGNKERGGFGPNDPEGQTPIPSSDTTIAELLKKAGYRTALVGKWGLGSPLPGETPLDHGFDFFYGYACQRRAHNYYPVYLWRNRETDLLNNPLYAAREKLDAPLGSEEEYFRRYGGTTYAPEKMSQECVKFVNSAKGKPFFLYFAPTLPHVALQAPKSWVDRFPTDWDKVPYLGQNGYLPNARPRATYAAMVAYLDHCVGEILNALDDTGAAKNTLIVFTSDNGAVINVGGSDVEFFQSNGPYRAGKMSLYEGGIRAPFVARWPGHISPETQSDEAIACYDALASMCDAAGIRAPKTDGRSYLPCLEGKNVSKRDHLYFEYPEASVMQSVYFGDFKVIRPNLRTNLQKVEVYDLASDPGETRNIAQDRPDLVERGLKTMSKEHVPSRLFPLGLVDAKRKTG